VQALWRWAAQSAPASSPFTPSSGAGPPACLLLSVPHAPLQQCTDPTAPAPQKVSPIRSALVSRAGSVGTAPGCPPRLGAASLPPRAPHVPPLAPGASAAAGVIGSFSCSLQALVSFLRASLIPAAAPQVLGGDIIKIVSPFHDDLRVKASLRDGAAGWGAADGSGAGPEGLTRSWSAAGLAQGLSVLGLDPALHGCCQGGTARLPALRAVTSPSGASAVRCRR